MIKKYLIASASLLIMLSCENGVEPIIENSADPIAIAAPAKNAKLEVGEKVVISWKANSNLVKGVNADLSIDEGKNYIPIGDGNYQIADSASFFPTENMVTQKGFIRIYDSSIDIASRTSADTLLDSIPISIVIPEGALVITAPGNGEILKVGDSVTVDWAADTQLVSSVGVKMSVDEGQNEKVIGLRSYGLEETFTFKVTDEMITGSGYIMVYDYTNEYGTYDAAAIQVVK